LGWDVLPGIANFLLCHLPDDGPDAATLVRLCRERNVFIRDAALMGADVGGRTVRIAVKDRETNGQMLRILSDVTGNASI
jgi:histidinol-phosphate/aromatic aminotransferase/cobyric acid decarboxylase-like protein